MNKVKIISIVCCLIFSCVAVYYFVPPLPQNLSYHNFADTLSNLAFIIVGLANLAFLTKHHHDQKEFIQPIETTPFYTTFICYIKNRQPTKAIN